MCRKDSVGSETIILANGAGSTLVDVVNIISLALGKTARATSEPSRPGEVTRYVADISKARELLDYYPQTPHSSGLIKTIDWWKESNSL